MVKRGWFVDDTLQQTVQGEELANHGGGCGLGWKELPAEYNFTVPGLVSSVPFHGSSPKVLAFFNHL